MARTPLSFGAWAMLTVACVILYIGALYYLSIAMGIDLVRWFQRFRLTVVVKVWRRGPEGRIAVIAGFIAFLLVIEAALVGFGEGPESPGPGPEGEWVVRSDNTVVTGRTVEGSGDDATPDLGGVELLAANLTLVWYDNDADAPGPGILPTAPQNEPDTFSLSVSLPDGTELSADGTSDPASTMGEITLEVPRPEEGNVTGWNVEVECVQAGDVVGPFGTVWADDDGNDWSLRVEYTYREFVPAEGSA